jgi:hypothetical protein
LPAAPRARGSMAQAETAAFSKILTRLKCR